ncbi:hypothetical protein ACIRQR_22595 [Streptomyces bacillaris]|uniref:hypothetical protein n=1 Tax=Streptomyces bacillaris TaxID=68179 RepID=UPI00381F42B5
MGSAVTGFGIVADSERERFAQLEAELGKGPAAHCWEDPRWTPSRVKTVIGRRFHLTYTIQGVPSF